MKIDKNGKYQTRDGKEVRFYAMDGQGECPIHGATLEENGWTFRTWAARGTYYPSMEGHETDLIPYAPAKKTPEEWFQELPSPIRERAIANIDREWEDFEEYPFSLKHAIESALHWSETKEGPEFWFKVSRISSLPKSGRTYPALPDDRDDFGNVVPAELLPLPEAPEGYKRKYDNGHKNPVDDGYFFDGDDWSYRDDWHPDEHVLHLIPEKQYWSEPEHFPAQAWITRPHWEGCAQITKIDWRGEIVYCAGYDRFSFDKLSECRWSENPFKQIKDGKECLVES